MDDLERLVQQLVEFKHKGAAVLSQKHPYVFSVIEMFFGERESKFGIQITENGQFLENYTFYLQGVKISRMERGILDSEVYYPVLGIIRPYVVIEKTAIEKVIADESLFEGDMAVALKKYLPDITVKYMPYTNLN